MGNGIKLLLMIFLGFLFIMAGVRGNVGSMLGALLTPAYMQDTSQQGSNNFASGDFGGTANQWLPTMGGG